MGEDQAVSAAQSVSCHLHTFSKSTGNRIDNYVLDANDSFAMNLSLQNGALGVVSASQFVSGHHNDLNLRLYRDRGGLEVSYVQGKGALGTCAGDDLETEVWQDRACDKQFDLFATFVLAALKRFGVNLNLEGFP